MYASGGKIVWKPSYSQKRSTKRRTSEIAEYFLDDKELRMLRRDLQGTG